MADSDKLINENANYLRFEEELACYVGLSESVVLQKLYRLMQKGDWGRVVDGAKWIRMSLPDWENELPFLDESTIRRTLDNLVGDNLVRTAVYEGRCKWYTIDVALVQALDGPVERISNRLAKRRLSATQATEKRVSVQNGQIENEGVSVQNGQIICPKWTDVSVQNGQLPRLLSNDPSKVSPNGESGPEPLEVRGKPKSRASPDKSVLRPDTPEQDLIFERWNQNRELQGRGKQKYFKTVQQKAKAQAAGERLGLTGLGKALDKVLGNGAETFNHVVNYIAKASQNRKGDYGDQTHRRFNEQFTEPDIVDRLSRPGAYRL